MQKILLKYLFTNTGLAQKLKINFNQVIKNCNFVKILEMAKKNFNFERLTKQIFKDVSDILLAVNKEHFQGKMISVSEVRLSPDKSILKVFLSIYPSQDSKEVIEQLMTMKSQIRFQLGNIIRHQVRIVPELQFYEDKTFDEIEKIDKLLSKNNHQNPTDETPKE